MKAGDKTVVESLILAGSDAVDWAVNDFADDVDAVIELFNTTFDSSGNYFDTLEVGTMPPSSSTWTVTALSSPTSTNPPFSSTLTATVI